MEAGNLVALVNHHEIMVNKEETHLFIDGEWTEILEDQEGEEYFMEGDKAIYIDGFYTK